MSITARVYLLLVLTLTYSCSFTQDGADSASRKSALHHSQKKFDYHYFESSLTQKYPYLKEEQLYTLYVSETELLAYYYKNKKLIKYNFPLSPTSFYRLLKQKLFTSGTQTRTSQLRSALMISTFYFKGNISSEIRSELQGKKLYITGKYFQDQVAPLVITKGKIISRPQLKRAIQKISPSPFQRNITREQANLPFFLGLMNSLQSTKLRME